MRVLLVNHTAETSGGERALVDLVTHLPARVEPVVASPAGPLSDALERLGIAHVPIRGSAGSLKLHPVRTPIAVGELVAAGVAVRRLAARWGCDLVHANSLRAGLSAVVSRRLGGPPALVHGHDGRGPGRAGALVARVVTTADGLLVNSRWTAVSLLGDRADRAEVVLNPLDLDRFAPTRADPGAVRRELGIGHEELVLCQLAQITPWKGQDDAIRVLAGLRARGRACRLLLAGCAKFVAKATRYDNRTFERGLHTLCDELGVTESVHFLGERSDVPAVLAASDLALLPSWEEPFGLAVAEAMAMGVPVAVTSAGGAVEVVGGGRHGLLLPPRRPERWVEALHHLLEDRTALVRLGAEGRRHVRETLGVQAYVERVIAVYDRVLAAERSR